MIYSALDSFFITWQKDNIEIIALSIWKKKNLINVDADMQSSSKVTGLDPHSQAALTQDVTEWTHAERNQQQYSEDVKLPWGNMHPPLLITLQCVH